jgi:hypothetical protein
MGFSSELHIEMHNEAMAADEAYAADYRRRMEEEYFMTLPSDDEFESDYRLDYTGYEEFRCPLCYEFSAEENGHKSCHDDERAWYERD